MGKSYKMYRPFRCVVYVLLACKKNCPKLLLPVLIVLQRLQLYFLLQYLKKTLVKENSKPYEKTSLSSEAVDCEW